MHLFCDLITEAAIGLLSMISDALQDGSTIEQGICLHEGISGWRDEVNENLLFQADVDQVAGI